MSRLDINDRVYAYRGSKQLSKVEAPCMWFAKCKNVANGLREGPIGDGELGPIPICQRCDDKCERLSNA